jgi:hypothetical protein
VDHDRIAQDEPDRPTMADLHDKVRALDLARDRHQAAQAHMMEGLSAATDVYNERVAELRAEVEPRQRALEDATEELLRAIASHFCVPSVQPLNRACERSPTSRCVREDTETHTPCLFCNDESHQAKSSARVAAALEAVQRASLRPPRR